MVTKAYMLDRPAAPGAARQAFDRTVMPALIDAAGVLEAAVERAAVRTRARPARMLGVVLVAGWCAGWLTRRG